MPDFLILGINSLGPQWVLVEIEAARHDIDKKQKAGSKGKRPVPVPLSSATDHAIQQIEDWRHWLTDNVGYAQQQLGLHGLNNRATGLVIIGRADPTTTPQPNRSNKTRTNDTAVRSWDWLLRAAKDRSRDTLSISDFAQENLAAQEENYYGSGSPSMDDLFD